MTLAQAWRRQLVGVSSAALVVPGTIVAALVVLALAGGLKLGSLGQVFNGPALPGGSELVAATHTRGAHRSSTMGALAATIAAGGLAGSTLIASLGSGGAPAGHGSHPGGGGPGVPNSAGGGPGGFSGGQQPPPHHRPPPTTAPGQPPTLVDGVVKLATSVTSRVPGPVGALATRVLASAGQTVDKVLPPPPPPPVHAAPTPPLAPAAPPSAPAPIRAVAPRLQPAAKAATGALHLP